MSSEKLGIGENIMKRKYTTKIHIERLKKMFKLKEPCRHCPAQRRFTMKEPFEMWAYNPYPCDICQEFVHIPSFDCPCDFLGIEEAIEQTLLAIEEYEKGASAPPHDKSGEINE